MLRYKQWGWSLCFHARGSTQQFFWEQHLMCTELLLTFGPCSGPPGCRCWAVHWDTLGSCWDWAVAQLWGGSVESSESSPPFMPHLLKSHLCSDWTAILLFTLLTTITHLKLIFCCNLSTFSQEEQLDSTELVWNYLKNWSRNCFEKFLHSNTYTLFFAFQLTCFLCDSVHRTAQQPCKGEAQLLQTFLAVLCRDGFGKIFLCVLVVV